MWHMINISILLLFLFALHIQGRTVLETQHINETYHLPTVRGKESYGDSCTDDEGCGERHKCRGETDAKVCECADGLGGADCQTEEWCEKGGKFENCAATGGTCKYETETRSVECTCGPDKKLHPTENKCRAISCENSSDCGERQRCVTRDGYSQTCVCADGLSGNNCEKNYWCEGNGKFKHCKGTNGTCEYDKEKRSMVCNCENGKALHPTQNRCAETCDEKQDCGNGGECTNNFCVCRPGLIGDKCETIIDCSTKGKFRGCNGLGAVCTFDGSKAVCTCPVNQEYHAKEHICKNSCRTDANCNANQICMYENGWKSCVCAAGLSGKFCEKKEWCAKGGRFENCKDTNGFCEYNPTKRSVECTCTTGKELHPTENRCREMCTHDFDCKNGGKCENNKICSCKSGLFGDKCQHIFDCSSKGKYKGCESSGGNCFYNGNETVCECPDNKIFHDTEHICKVIETSTWDTTDSSSVRTKIFTSTVPTCYCGSATKSCYLDSFGDKYCSCLSGYVPVNGYCAAICGEDKCVHGKCETVENNFKCRCNEGFTGKRCEDRIQTKSDKQDLWTILQVVLMFAIFLLLSVMFCFLARIKTKH